MQRWKYKRYRCRGRERNSRKDNHANKKMSEEKVEVKEKSKSAMAIASLPLGIISIIFNLFWFISLPTGILAIIFGAKTTRKLGSKMGKAGLITGIVGVSICAFIYISIIMITILGIYY